MSAHRAGAAEGGLGYLGYMPIIALGIGLAAVVLLFAADRAGWFR